MGDPTNDESKHKNVMNYLSDDEIVSTAWVFLAAAYDTTATTLACLAYELALNPDKQQSLYEEVSGAFESDDNIDCEFLSKLPYLHSVLSESLRLHPPLLNLKRYASKDYKLGDTGIVIEKGHAVEIPIYAMQRSEQFFTAALKFMPERFSASNKDKIVPYSYLPFAEGPRNCIGMRFALMIAKYCLFKLIYNFKLSKCNETDIPIILCKSHLLATPKRVVLSVAKRQRIIQSFLF